jgi:hypothetical protein
MLAAVRQEVIRRWRAAQNANDRKFWVSVGESFKSPDAATYALHVQQWEQLSLAERQARKAERAQPYQQQHMAHKPPRLVKKPMRPCRQWLV